MYETLIWEETFPGCSLNEHNWNRRVGNWQLSSDGQPVVPGWGNRERQYYTPHNLEVHDAMSVVVARVLMKRLFVSVQSVSYTHLTLPTIA